MDILGEVRNVVADELEAFRREYTLAMQGGRGWLQDCLDFLTKKQGKQIRPLLTLLAAKACSGKEETSQVVQCAVLLEVLHTATLVHDDVVDDTRRRRGNPTLNAAFDNRLAVLTGDYLFSSSAARAAELNDTRITRVLAGLGKDLAEGEVAELELAEQGIIDEAAYMQVIQKKTASLLSACAELGALSGGGSEDEKLTLRDFGKHLGFCFQIRDDIFDYYDAEIGKPTGHDLLEGKITLPLLFALSHDASHQADDARRIIFAKDFTAGNVQSLIAFAKRAGGIAYAEQVMDEHFRTANSLLSTLPPSPAGDALKKLATYLVVRNH
ncbi:MAG: polyprenyl synthetase family protein [Tannerellaceae bacterium]|jgi:octaprenyl-diphosphate synthase|nr:polyprenyl synthetase family protein [Tannerellaceae bacterium]